MPTIEADAISGDTVESLEAVEGSGAGIRPVLDRYAAFVEAVTGFTPSDDLTADDCYRIGNRIEAFVEERHRAGEWDETVVEGYPVVESRSEVLALARLFRRCHEERVEERH
ncbi:hypothetical protein N0B31_09565 [Salinirubellus salinus]|jgi:hypothetical protein|uniref:Uncharacterized protein n=1 Tax=Salinirubellus salinus TaxID=1364945 RepID=A0A9E7UCQ7_9EURY|nr:hypothetical protein [Salinirubellus salinus]UWM56522.1 hypothetical protein N0B31_09565 [Salinirubellus salinus]